MANMSLNHLLSFLRFSIQGKSLRLEQSCTVNTLSNPGEDERVHSSFPSFVTLKPCFAFSLIRIYPRACSFSMWSTWPHPFGRVYYYGQGWFGLQQTHCYILFLETAKCGTMGVSCWHPVVHQIGSLFSTTSVEVCSCAGRHKSACLRGSPNCDSHLTKTFVGNGNTGMPSFMKCMGP